MTRCTVWHGRHGEMQRCGGNAYIPTDRVCVPRTLRIIAANDMIGLVHDGCFTRGFVEDLLLIVIATPAEGATSGR